MTTPNERRAMTSQAELADIIWAAACHHEAAHAAVAMSYGTQIGEIRLSLKVGFFSGPQPLGFTDDIDTDYSDDEAYARSIVVSLAGPEAEAHCLSSYGLRRGRVRSIVESHAGGDRDHIRKDLDGMSYVDRGLMRRLDRETQALVSDLWDSISNIAEALSDNDGYLSGGQIHDIA